MKKYIIILLLASGILPVNAQSKLNAVAKSDKMKWWTDAKFGMFIHWGVYSVPAGYYQGKEVPGIGEWIMNKAKIPMAEYQAFANSFNPVNYNPEAWVQMAKNAGIKYIIITAKHHDGFAMFDSKVSNWDITSATPYGKDVLKPLVAACRKEGIRIGFYYSQAQDWNHPGGAASGGHWDKGQDGDMDAYLDKIAVPQVKEILNNYGDIDILWWDTPQDMTPARAAKFIPVIKQYPNLITNNRLGGGYNGDTETPEQFVPPTGFPGRNWETCMTMNDTWGYKSNDHNWKSPAKLIRDMVDAVSKGGNFLLNVGPTSLGDIPQPSIERLADIGEWMKINHESIYGSTASPFPYLSWGRCTRKGQKLYLHVFDRPTDGKLNVPMANRITKAYLLANPGKLLTVQFAGDHSFINLPKQLPDTINTVVVVQFAGEPKIEPSLVLNKPIIASSQKDEASTAKNMLDGNRQTRWEAAKGERKASIEINLEKPVDVATVIVDEPWFPWENKKQDITLQYKAGNSWVTVCRFTTGGSGQVEKFKPVKAQFFRLLVENKTNEPAILEWQLYSPGQ